MKELKRITIIACGTSWHAGLVGKFLIEGLARLNVEVDLASEFRYRDPIIGKGDLLLAISQSGETADTLAAMKEARSKGAKVICIANVVDSSIPRASHGALYTHAGPEIGVASTKAFTTQLAALVLLAIHLGRRTGALDEGRAATLIQELLAIPHKMTDVVSLAPQIQVIARRYGHARDFLFLGRGNNYPIALEGALKLKEISYIHAEGYASGEMKHGPIALIDENMPIVVIAPRGPGYEKVMSNLAEVKAREGKIIAHRDARRSRDRHARRRVHPHPRHGARAAAAPYRAAAAAARILRGGLQGHGHRSAAQPREERDRRVAPGRFATRATLELVDITAVTSGRRVAVLRVRTSEDPP